MGQLRALVTGISGQDGTYLAEYLLKKGYEVHGFGRRGSVPIDERVVMHFGDLVDPAAVTGALAESQPNEIYNLGAQSHVHASFEHPEYTFKATGIPILVMLEYVIKHLPHCRVYQASSSEMFGDMPPPQDEFTAFAPRSPYAIAKCAAHHTVQLYRKLGLFVVGGILFNHESPRRAPSFVTRKISRAVARIASDRQHELVLGNIEAKRDWGFAGDYVDAMWRMLQQEMPRDFVIATGESHTVQDFVITAFRVAEDITGKRMEWDSYVRLDQRYQRPAEVPYLCGEATRAQKHLGWQPTVRFQELVRMMVAHDLNEVSRTS